VSCKGAIGDIREMLEAQESCLRPATALRHGSLELKGRNDCTNGRDGTSSASHAVGGIQLRGKECTRRGNGILRPKERLVAQKKRHTRKEKVKAGIEGTSVASSCSKKDPRFKGEPGRTLRTRQENFLINNEKNLEFLEHEKRRRTGVFTERVAGGSLKNGSNVKGRPLRV